MHTHLPVSNGDAQASPPSTSVASWAALARPHHTRLYDDMGHLLDLITSSQCVLGLIFRASPPSTCMTSPPHHNACLASSYAPALPALA
eukprot:451658-Pelagomonas_calceolata.AAC.1